MHVKSRYKQQLHLTSTLHAHVNTQWHGSSTIHICAFLSSTCMYEGKAATEYSSLVPMLPLGESGNEAKSAH